MQPTGKEWLVDQIDPALILADAKAARAAGAELVVVSMHWGNEYAHDVGRRSRGGRRRSPPCPGSST